VTGSGGQSAHLARLERLSNALGERQVDALLVCTPVNIRYLTGFTGTSALALVAANGRAAEAGGEGPGGGGEGPGGGGEGPDGGGGGSGARDAGAGALAQHRFLTDFRYATQSAAQVDASFEREIVSGELLDAAARALHAAAPDGGRLGFDDATLTVAQHARLGEQLGSAWRLVPCGGAIERLRAVKDPGEIARIRAAAELADAALARVLERGLAGRSEREVAIELELQMRRLGAEASSFPTIVAAGAHAALPHAEPREQTIPADVLVTIDWGALHEGYCSDCTRTYATGEHVSEQARAIYELVRDAQAQALAAVRPGPSGRELDAVARAVIERAGQGEHFGHGLGHGVGLEIHEGPRLSRTAGDEPLLAGNVVTVEPGVYLPGECGVRIEDLVVVEGGGGGDRGDGGHGGGELSEGSGHRVLSGLPKELTVVA
jgi:Xaa-Pro aminopeptidase